MPSSRRPANPLALAVLTLLDERAMHPYEMSSTLRQRNKEHSIKLNFGSLYAVVESLQRNGWVEVLDTVREGRRPERTVYAITDAGRTMMVDWLSDLLETPSKEFPAFEAALSLMMALPPDDVIALLDRRAHALAMRLSADRALQSSVPSTFPRVFMIEGEFAVAMREAELAFVRGMLDDLHAGSFGGLPMWRRLEELRDQGEPAAEIERLLTAEFGALSFEEPLP